MSAPKGAFNSLDKAVAQAHVAIGALLQLELSNGQTVLHYFGGGYEVATFVANRFQKLGDTTYLFWFVQEQDAGGVRVSSKVCIIGQHYIDDLLIVRSAVLDYVPGEVEIRDPAIHLIPPVYRDVAPDEATLRIIPPFAKTRVLQSVVMRSRTGQTGVLVRYETGSAPSLTLDEADGKLSFGVTEEFMKSILEEAAERLAINPNVDPNQPGWHPFS